MATRNLWKKKFNLAHGSTGITVCPTERGMEASDLQGSRKGSLEGPSSTTVRKQNRNEMGGC